MPILSSLSVTDVNKATQNFMPPICLNSRGRWWLVAGGGCWIELKDQLTGVEMDELKRLWQVHRASLKPDRVVVSPRKEFRVPSSNGSSTYIVSSLNGQWSCNCPAFGFRRKCKHIEAAKIM